MITIQNHSTDPTFNLAFEEYYFKQADMGDDIFILWRNEPAIVVGKNQDTRSEINAEYVTASNIQVVRRITGGGAVYHDLGNINFSAIRETGGDTGFATFAAPIVAYLKGLGAEATFGGRNDILIDGRKISGNAQCYHKNKVLHHGTLLYQSDLGVLEKALNSRTEKLSAKGIQSVRSRVANISDYLPVPLSVEEFMSGLAESVDPAMTIRLPSTEELEAIGELANTKYRTREWNYGDLPEINLMSLKRFDAGLIEAKMYVSDGIIREIVLSGDFFEGPLPLERLRQTLIGNEYDLYEIHGLLERLNVSEYIQGLKNHELLSLLFSDK